MDPGTFLVMDSGVCALKSDSLALASTYCGALDNSLSFPAVSIPSSELVSVMMSVMILRIIVLLLPHRLLAD